MVQLRTRAQSTREGLGVHLQQRTRTYPARSDLWRRLRLGCSLLSARAYGPVHERGTQATVFNALIAFELLCRCGLSQSSAFGLFLPVQSGNDLSSLIRRTQDGYCVWFTFALLLRPFDIVITSDLKTTLRCLGSALTSLSSLSSTPVRITVVSLSFVVIDASTNYCRFLILRRYRRQYELLSFSYPSSSSALIRITVVSLSFVVIDASTNHCRYHILRRHRRQYLSLMLPHPHQC